ncbi:MAG: hypothetical protein LBQ12_05170 [Deltaproteobacteria bacterium]|nr:hypothetical protein [Deltaproteobacteria bacterium]
MIPAGPGGGPCRVEPKNSKNSKNSKNPKDVRSDSLQNFSDPDVTCSGHKGKGLEAQTAELFDCPALFGDGDGERLDRKSACIYSVDVEDAEKHDQYALAGGIERGRQLGADADVVLADTDYGSFENYQMAKGKGFEQPAPIPGKAPKAAPGTLEAPAPAAPPAQRPESCPCGEDGGPAGELDVRVCPDCPCLNRCRAAVSSKKAVNGKRRTDMAAGKSKALYRMLAEKEATYSIGNNKRGISRLRIRGILKASLKIKMTALYINLG